MILKNKPPCLLIAAALVVAAATSALSAEALPAVADGPLSLARAVMCEYIEGYEPQHVASVFSIDAGKISCFTTFDGIQTFTHALHKWYRRDSLITTKRLTLKPPSWSTYSSIQLREADKGPWRVEIWSARNQLLQILRFSVID